MDGFVNNNGKPLEQEINKIPINELISELPSYFDFDGNINQSAYLNWRLDDFRSVEGQFYEMGNAYYETAMVLLEKCLVSNSDKKADMWIFPIMFNTIHGIEIYLKGFNAQIKTLQTLEKEERYAFNQIEGNHDIKQLCNVAIRRFNEYVNESPYIDSKDESTKEKKNELLFIKKFIEILYENTKDMSAMRYPINTGKELQFYNKSKENVTVSLLCYKIWLYKIFSILESLTSYIEFEVDELLDLLAEIYY